MCKQPADTEQKSIECSYIDKHHPCFNVYICGRLTKMFFLQNNLCKEILT